MANAWDSIRWTWQELWTGTSDIDVIVNDPMHGYHGVRVPQSMIDDYLKDNGDKVSKVNFKDALGVSWEMTKDTLTNLVTGETKEVKPDPTSTLMSGGGGVGAILIVVMLAVLLGGRR